MRASRSRAQFRRRLVDWLAGIGRLDELEKCDGLAAEWNSHATLARAHCANPDSRTKPGRRRQFARVRGTSIGRLRCHWEVGVGRAGECARVPATASTQYTRTDCASLTEVTLWQEALWISPSRIRNRQPTGCARSWSRTSTRAKLRSTV